ncbi:MAG: response regulator transcription factor [Halanaerobium sp.]|nr:response regulator transcription factor [Halanaerobium sp.]
MKPISRLKDRKILLIDDEVELLHLLETVLTREGFTKIYKAAAGKTGLEICREERPDIIVLDIMLPDMDGFQVCKEIRQFTYAPIIFLSARSEDVDKILGLGIGGDDYVTKPFSPKEVAFRIKAQLRRRDYLVDELQQEDGGKVISCGGLAIDSRKALVIKDGKQIPLTAKELEILLLLARHPNQIFSKKAIYDHVWGQDYIGDDNTIMVHIRHLREKVEDRPSEPEYIITVKGLGYKMAAKGG